MRCMFIEPEHSDITDVAEIIGLSQKLPNLVGGIMDDFFNATRPAFEG